MNNGVSINIEEINNIAENLKKSGQDISNVYENECAPALNMSSDCLVLTGLNMDVFNKAMGDIYNKLSDSLIICSEFLFNVANNYNDISQVIANRFNKEFADSVHGILGNIDVINPNVNDQPKPTPHQDALHKQQPINPNLNSNTGTKGNIENNFRKNYFGTPGIGKKPGIGIPRPVKPTIPKYDR